jgi:hypothetical protein
LSHAEIGAWTVPVIVVPAPPSHAAWDEQSPVHVWPHTPGEPPPPHVSGATQTPH